MQRGAEVGGGAVPLIVGRAGVTDARRTGLGTATWVGADSRGALGPVSTDR